MKLDEIIYKERKKGNLFPEAPIGCSFFTNDLDVVSLYEGKTPSKFLFHFYEHRRHKDWRSYVEERWNYCCPNKEFPGWSNK